MIVQTYMYYLIKQHNVVYQILAKMQRLWRHYCKRNSWKIQTMTDKIILHLDICIRNIQNTKMSMIINNLYYIQGVIHISWQALGAGVGGLGRNSVTECFENSDKILTGVGKLVKLAWHNMWMTQNLSV